jgi:tetratricopeptide (TPR) repeat protein
MKTRFLLLLPLLLFAFGCQTLHVGPGYVVHDEQEAMNFAWFWFKNENYAQAVKMANVALEISPASEDAYTLLGLAELRMKSLNKAIEYLHKADEIKKSVDNSHRGNTLNNLGFALIKDKQYSVALRVFEESNMTQPSYIADFGIAMCLLNLGEKDKAEQLVVHLKDSPKALEVARKALKYFSIDDDESKSLIDNK